MGIRVSPRSFVAVLVTTALFGCSGGAYSRGTSEQRVTSSVTRPANLAPGTRVYHPTVIQIEAPGETYVVSPDSVIKTTAKDITVRTANGERTFSLATSKVTYDAPVQELYVPPGHPVPKNAGRLVDIIR